jgi:hypothetical protein
MMGTTMSVEIFAQDHSAEHGLTAILEDDGRVAYAYLVRDKRIVADVWVYNRCATPAEPEWSKGTTRRPPFANSSGFVNSAVAIELPTSNDDVSFAWHVRADGTPEVAIHVGAVHAASLAESETPGRALLAGKDGPVARVLNRSR